LYSVGNKLAGELKAELIQPTAGELTARELFRSKFFQFDRWVLIMACGIAVRFLDGLPEDKHGDPAVVVLDEGCHYAISLLSGHEGGANALAFEVANIVGATPVISTASEATKRLVLGIGCRRGVSSGQIAEAVNEALGGRELQDVRCVATVSAKANEPGLLAFCQEHKLPLRILSHADVAARAWVSRPSQWVKATLGLDGVCEPCALIASPRGDLVVPKRTRDGVAVAVVEDALRFEK
jgi:cobalt-precorrin 5A hydrolase